MMIVSQLCGGLGNQMFQYALGRQLSLMHEVPQVLDISLLAADTQRRYALGAFQTTAPVGTDAELRWYRPWPLRMPPKFSWLPRWPGRLTVVRERSFAFNPEVMAAGAKTYLEGYWQSERYFFEASDTLRQEFQLTDPMTSVRRAVAQEIASSNSISVHVRRGDYVTNPAANAWHGTCPPDWYDAAMSAMAGLVDSPTFFVFSDDCVWARQNLPPRWPTVFVEPQADGRDQEDMHLMALCRHHIIANSSFSWWGAWLNPRPDKHVIAPLRWFNHAKRDTRDLLPAGWARL